MTQVKSMRTLLLLFLFCLTAIVSAAAYDYEPDVKAATSDMHTVYNALYVGMSEQDFITAMSNKQWEKTGDSSSHNSRIITYQRKYSKWVELRSPDKAVRQDIYASFFNSKLLAFSVAFYTKDRDLAEKIQYMAYNNLRSKLWEPYVETHGKPFNSYGWKEQNGFTLSVFTMDIRNTSISEFKEGFEYCVRISRRQW